jgi:hypothetical protein
MPDGAGTDGFVIPLANARREDPLSETVKV